MCQFLLPSAFLKHCPAYTVKLYYRWENSGPARSAQRGQGECQSSQDHRNPNINPPLRLGWAGLPLGKASCPLYC